MKESPDETVGYEYIKRSQHWFDGESKRTTEEQRQAMVRQLQDINNMRVMEAVSTEELQ